VRVENLKSEAGKKMNGVVGVVHAFDEAQQRWQVEVEVEVEIEGERKEVEVPERVRVRTVVPPNSGTRDAGKVITREQAGEKKVKMLQLQRVHRMARKVKSLKSENLSVVKDVEGAMLEKGSPDAALL